MALTSTEMIDEILENLANRDDLSRARTLRHLNIAQRQLVRAKPGGWRDLNGLADKTISNTGSDADRFIDLGSVIQTDGTTIREIRMVYSVRRIGDNPGKLIRKHWKTWDRLLPDTTELSRGKPTHYTQYRNTIEVFRIPDVNYTLRLRYSLWPIDLDETTQTSTDLVGLEDLLILKATTNLLESFGRSKDGSKFLAIYEEQLQKVLDEEGEDPDLEFGINPGELETEGRGVGEYWRDPFIRGINS